MPGGTPQMKHEPKRRKNKRLLELLGGEDVVPAEFKEVLITESMSLRSAVRKDNECHKTCYGSESAAKKAIRHRLRRGSNTNFLRAYFCKICKAWHMTSVPLHNRSNKGR